MSTAAAPVAPAAHPLPSAAWWWIAVAVAACWALVLRACWWEWSLNPQYSYGMLVPLLSLILLGRRWPDRPAATVPSAGGRRMALILLFAAALLLGATQPFVVSNADWRMVPAVAAASGTAMTLCGIYLLGGAPWLRHFGFPVLFFLVAVPWPRPQEAAIMAWLMPHNSALCVEALHWLGYAAEQRGNLIAIPGALLGVEEACSGIRSLQSMVMVALAIGEFFRLAPGRRVLLLILGLGAALGGNALRSLTLSVAACRSGAQAVDGIHDATGLAVLALASAVVLLAGYLLAPRHRTEATRGNTGFALSSLPQPGVGVRTTVVVLLALWGIFLSSSEAWFRWHEAGQPAFPPIWTLTAPVPSENAREVPIAERTLDILLYPDTAKSEQWRDDNGRQWQSFYFHWPPGPTSVQSAFVVHDPRVCLGASGFELERVLPTWSTEAGGFTIPFQRYLFRDRGRPVQVFHAVVEDDGASVLTGGNFDRSSRWHNLLSGRRNRGLRVLEIAVRGSENPAEAEAAVAQWLQRRITAEDQRP